MKRILAVFSLFCCAIHSQTPAAKPKLVVAIIVDQFRYEYLQRFSADYHAGFKRLVDQGAVMDNAHYIHAGTETAPGHSTFLSGATPSISGIIANEWYDRASKIAVTSVEDHATTLVGGVPGEVGASPVNLLVETLGDKIRQQGGESRIVGVSFKDRAAILPAGRAANGAYWWSTNSNSWVTSTFYMKALPDWVKEINRSRPYMRGFGAQWFALDAKKGDAPFCTMVAGDEKIRYCASLMATPWGNEMIEEFAERALTAEQLGQHSGTDLLTVSFSSNDAVGHAVGPDAPEVRDISRRTDMLLGKLLDAIDREAGLGNVTLVLTADHGVAPMAPIPGQTVYNPTGGRLSTGLLTNAVQDALTAKFGEGDWMEANTGTMLVLRRETANKCKAEWAQVQEVAAEAARKFPHIARVYTDAEFQKAPGGGEDEIEKAMRRSYYHGRSPDLMILPDEYYNFDSSSAVHGTPYEYDTHVPIIFFGAGVRHGRYAQAVAPNDIAPTLSDIIGVAVPSSAVGHVIREIRQ
jgi:predicted AlkP superfamily pyrophosphatase or phosphodiesterase